MQQNHNYFCVVDLLKNLNLLQQRFITDNVSTLNAQGVTEPQLLHFADLL